MGFSNFTRRVRKMFIARERGLKIREKEVWGMETKRRRKKLQTYFLKKNTKKNIAFSERLKWNLYRYFRPYWHDELFSGAFQQPPKNAVFFFVYFFLSTSWYSWNLMDSNLSLWKGPKKDLLGGYGSDESDKSLIGKSIYEGGFGGGGANHR